MRANSWAAVGEGEAPAAARNTTHGTYAAYRRGCRCEPCATYQRERVARNRRDRLDSGRLNHGTRSAYDAGCRCRPCTRARRWADWNNGHSRLHPEAS